VSALRAKKGGERNSGKSTPITSATAPQERREEGERTPTFAYVHSEEKLGTHGGEKQSVLRVEKEKGEGGKMVKKFRTEVEEGRKGYRERGPRTGDTKSSEEKKLFQIEWERRGGVPCSNQVLQGGKEEGDGGNAHLSNIPRKNRQSA